MARVIEMPKLSDTMEEGGIANWLKKEGEAIREGEPLVEIETDKATQEYESPAAGVLLKIIVQPGRTVPLRAPIAVIGAKGETFEMPALGTPAGGAAAAKSPSPAAVPVPGPAAAPAATSTAPAVVGGRIKVSPLARKLAAEAGIDLNQVAGSGPGGRIVQRDLESRGAPAAVGQTKGPAVPAVTAGDRASSVVNVSMMRKTIAKRLTAAKNDAPHFYLTVSADMTRAEDWRQRLNAEAAAAKGAPLPKVSVNDLVIHAVSRALRQHPMVNASWQGETIVQHGGVHVAVAVALPEGLVTPVIRGTDQLSLRRIAAAGRDLVEKARAGRLANEDYAGGTFTISNLGMFGIEEFTAIINPPQAAILAVGAVRKEPCVDDDGELTVAARMKMTLSCDHRVVDGATGAQFLQTLVAYLEDPLSMMA